MPDETTPATTAPTPETTDSESGEVRDPRALLSALERLKAESKAQKSELEKLRATAKSAEDSTQSDTERLTRRVAELEGAAERRTRAHRESIARYEISIAATRQHIIDPDAATKLLDWSDITFDDDGTPKGVDRALAALVKARPWLAAPAPSPSPANASTRSTSGEAMPRYTRAQLLDTAFYREHRADIQRAFREGRIDE